MPDLKKVEQDILGGRTKMLWMMAARLVLTGSAGYLEPLDEALVASCLLAFLIEIQRSGEDVPTVRLIDRTHQHPYHWRIGMIQSLLRNAFVVLLAERMVGPIPGPGSSAQTVFLIASCILFH
jgi:hypothetical protein